MPSDISRRAELIAKLLRLADDCDATPAERALARQKALEVIAGRLTDDESEAGEVS